MLSESSSRSSKLLDLPRGSKGAPMAGSEELGLREDTLRVLAAFLKQGEAAGSPIPTPPRPSHSRLLCPGGPAAGRAGPRAAEIPTKPRVTGCPSHREGSPATEAGGLAGRGGRSHQPEGGHPGSFTRGLEFTPGLRASSAAATRLNLRILGSLCACLSSLVFSSGLWGGSFPP
ncbi:bcl-2-like protein 12 isoform X6 [Artibeus jamaicensis]|uniref:bcl-2-like protein 12 isoform X6 n=1 Tax=Artibeus jamaicensis TaxID=9417 RepID=UPI00235ABC68|nr:bcl-2-like protein 12 isoform X6 [Artibeus jamaicensis]